MEIISKIKEILNLQSENNRSISFDIVLKNGNLQIRAFQITSLDESSELIEGLTRLEIYSSLREKREPVYCKFHLGEIREVICQELEYQEA